MENVDLFKYTEQFPAEFAAAKTFAEFAASLDGSKPGTGRLLQHIAAKYPDSWELYYRTIKAHGFVSRALAMPEAKSVRDIFASVSLYPYEIGGKFRSELQYVRAGAAFISGTRAKGFDYFGRLGAIYEWSPKWLERGDKVRSVRSGTQWLTGAVPTHEVVKAYGAIAGPGEWELATFEAVRRNDGRILIIARSSNGFGNRWLALLDEGETALSMLDDHERGEIAAELEARRAAWGE
jgi:hypothetical protein